MGGVGVLVVIYVWAGLAAFVTLLWLAIDLARLPRNKPTLAFAYAGLVLENTSSQRQAAAIVLVTVLPPLAGWLASVGCAADANCGLDLEGELLWCTPAILWLVNWLFWLGSSARTLGDRLAGGRLVARPRVSASMRPRSWWIDALLLAPPVLGMPVSGGTGGFLGLLAALFILAIPVGVTRSAVAFTPQHH